VRRRPRRAHILPDSGPVVNQAADRNSGHPHPGRALQGAAQYRPVDKDILVPYGPAPLDLDVCFWVHARIDELRGNNESGLQDLSPQVPSLQVCYDSRALHTHALLSAERGCWPPTPSS
jgi:hypothetical protein